jgi:hypothetical protein
VGLNNCEQFTVDVMKWEELRYGVENKLDEFSEKLSAYDCVMGMNDLQGDLSCVFIYLFIYLYNIIITVIEVIVTGSPSHTGLSDTVPTFVHLHRVSYFGLRSQNFVALDTNTTYANDWTTLHRK